MRIRFLTRIFCVLPAGSAGRTATCVTVILLCLALPTNAQSRVLTGSAYFRVVRAALARAEQSIDIQMYFIIAEKDSAAPFSVRTAPVRLLVEELIDAAERGVAVRVVLEDRKLSENYRAYSMLQAAGIEVRFDGPASLLHSKLIVIDGHICIVGSTNWSRAALRDNHEVALLVESRELARELLATFDDIDLRTLPCAPVTTGGLAISASFLRAAARMVHDRADYAFDLYLLLVRAAQETRTVTLDIEKYKKVLGCRNLRRPRLRLEKRYELIAYDAGKRLVTLAGESGPALLRIPYEYWDYGLREEMSLRAKFMWLVNLKEASESKRNPCWFRSQTDLAERYGISEYTLSLGLRELERMNLIEILRDVADGSDHADRKANIYRVNPLVAPEMQAARLRMLKEEHGAEKVMQAVDLAGQLDDPKDVDKIVAFLRLIERYGWEAVRDANGKTAGMKRGSGRRTVEATAGLLK